jgi:hypothetical protein
MKKLTEIKNIKTKEEARNIAINWQSWQSKQALSYGEIAKYQDYFRSIGIKFGLIREFKENAII